ncbi:GNAT family N-acetyltransferase [Halothermothrix orenii]|uniref:Acetyltransferase n=1 Tax=Halothermothrix orenii (strain H 168 / OCM 544 / DSM 9562) TaxID=373903 RepID=B8D1H5_HALOH|nr:GNAT family N-acetyltransferase [Halothermothrix orenii]ACL69052.1 Acetyltransferase [Halothermothrix orenii H 168]
MRSLSSPDNSVCIRGANTEDAGKVLILIRRAFKDYLPEPVTPGEYILPAFRDNIDEIVKDIVKNRVLIMEKDSLIIGSLRLVFEGSTSVYLKRFAILPGYQGQGYGSLLLRYAEDEARNMKGCYLYLHSTLDNDKLVKFYLKNGYRCVRIDNSYPYRRGLWVKRLNGVDQ